MTNKPKTISSVLKEFDKEFKDYNDNQIGYVLFNKVMVREIKDFIKSQILEILEEVEMKKKDYLWHWRTDDGREGVIKAADAAPFEADGMSSQYVWNQAVSELKEKIEKVKK